MPYCLTHRADPEVRVSDPKGHVNLSDSVSTTPGAALAMAQGENEGDYLLAPYTTVDFIRRAPRGIRR